MIRGRYRERQQSCKKESAYGWNDHGVPPGNFGRVTPGILLLWIWIVKGFPQISGFKMSQRCKNFVGWVNRVSTFRTYSRACPVQALLVPALSAWHRVAKTAPLSAHSRA